MEHSPWMTLISKRPETSDLRVFINKLKRTCADLLWVGCFWIISLISGRVWVCHVFTKYGNGVLKSLTSRVKLFLNSSEQWGTSLQGCPGGSQNRSKGARGEAKIGPRGAPRKFRKPGQEKRAGAGKWIANGSKMGPQISRSAVLLVIFFNISPHHLWDEVWKKNGWWLWDCFLHDFHALFGCLRVSFWN